jgi:hypothetical protein
MLNPLEYPWLFLICAVFLAILLFVIKPEKYKIFCWTAVIFFLGLAFGLDYFVRTDTEKIKNIIDVINETAEKENCDLVAPYIAPDYSDSHHSSRKRLLARCRSRLSEPLVEKAVSQLQSLEFNQEKTRAEADFTMRILFDSDSYAYQYRRVMIFKITLTLKTNPKSKWLIKSARLSNDSLSEDFRL